MDSMLSEKGFPLKIINGYKFRENGPTKKGIKWRCTVKTCKSFIFIDISKCELLEEYSCLDHNHPASDTLHRAKMKIF